MPNLFVVGNQKSLAELAPALLRPRTSVTVRESAFEAIRRANPSLDLDRIHPGTVIVVPPVAGTRSAATDDPARRAADQLVERVRAGLESLVAATESAEEQRGVEKKQVQELFGTAQVKRLAAAVPELAANIESVRGGFKEDDVAARKQLKDVHESADLWAKDLETLRGLL